MDAQQYRGLIGRFATGVTVITTQVDRQLHGMTANAVCSLSLDPLLLLCCVEKSASCHRQLERAEHFAINILAHDQQPVSQRFAVAQEPSEDLGVPYQLSTEGVPLIEGCLAHLVCRSSDRHEGGDHSIFVGEVVAGHHHRPQDSPLLFFGGAYRWLA